MTTQHLAQNSPILHESPPEMSASPSEGVTTSPLYSRPPDPPDIHRSGQESYGRPINEVDRSSALSNGLSTRLRKIEFPSFDGSDLRGWIQRCEQFFALDGTLSEHKVRLASLYMKGKGSQWHYTFISNSFGHFPSWSEYIIKVASRFGELYDDPLSELVSLKQAGEPTVVYLEKFENALTRLSLPEAHALSIFFSNMDPHLVL